MFSSLNFSYSMKYNFHATLLDSSSLFSFFFFFFSHVSSSSINGGAWLISNKLCWFYHGIRAMDIDPAPFSASTSVILIFSFEEVALWILMSSSCFEFWVPLPVLDSVFKVFRSQIFFWVSILSFCCYSNCIAIWFHHGWQSRWSNFDWFYIHC